MDEHHWLFIDDEREDLRYVYAMPASRNATDLRKVLQVSCCNFKPGEAFQRRCVGPGCTTQRRRRGLHPPPAQWASAVQGVRRTQMGGKTRAVAAVWACAKWPPASDHVHDC